MNELEQLKTKIKSILDLTKRRKAECSFTDEMNLREVLFALECVLDNKVSEGRKKD